MKREILTISLAIVLALVATGTSIAQESELVSRWEFNVGSLITKVDTDVRADSSQAGRGTAIDLEEVLQFDDSETLLRLRAARMFGRRHQLGVHYIDLSRRASRDINTEIRFRDLIIPVTTQVESDFDMRLLDLRYTYWAVLKEKTAFGVKAGVGQWQYDLALAADLRLLGRTTSDVSVEELVPLIGIEVRQLITPKLMFAAVLQGLTFDIGNTSGDVFNADVGFQYQASKRVGVAISFDLLTANIDIEQRLRSGNYQYELSGIELYIPIRLD